MATSAALISYPCFEVLEKSNVSFVESTPHQRKCRRSRCDKKEKLADKNLLHTENYIAEYRFTCNSENATNNLPKSKTKDVKVLPTLEENEEKEVMIRKFLELPTTSFENKAIHTIDVDCIVPSQQNETMEPKSKFSNHSLIVHNALTSECTGSDSAKERIPNSKSKSDLFVESSLNLNENNSTAYLTECKREAGSHPTNKHMPGSSRLNKEDRPTLMPNTREFEETILHESSKMPIKLAIACTVKNKSKNISNPCKRLSRPSNWRIILGVLGAFSLTVAMMVMTVNNIIEKSTHLQKHEIPIYNPTNYEIVLLIGRNVRRLIVSSIYSTNLNVN